MVKIVQVIPRRKNTWIELVASTGERAKLPLAEVPAGVVDGAQLDAGQWAGLLDRAAYCQAFETCVRILARREHFPLELRNKLVSRGIDSRHITEALAACRQRGYIDERRAAEQLVDTLLTRGGIGRARFQAALAQRGCPRELARDVLAARLGDLDEGEIARDLLGRRRRSFASKLKTLAEKTGPQALEIPRERRQVFRKLGAAVMRYVSARGLVSTEARQAAVEFTRSLMEEH